MEYGLFLNGQLSQIGGIRPLTVALYATLHGFHLYVLRTNVAEFGIPRHEFLRAPELEGTACSGGHLHPWYKNPTLLNQESYDNRCPSDRVRHVRGVDYATFGFGPSSRL